MHVGLLDRDLVGSALYRPSLMPASPCPAPFTCYARSRELCGLRQGEKEGRRCSFSAPLRDGVKVVRTRLSETIEQSVRECSRRSRYMRLGIRMRRRNEGRGDVGRAKDGSEEWSRWGHEEETR